MLSQLGQMMSQAGASGASSGPVNYDLARQIATSQVPATHPASSIDVAKVADAVALAEVWLDGATSMPAGVRTSTAWTPRQWIDATMPTWEKLCSPIAEQVSRAWVDGLPGGGEGAGRSAAGDDGLDGRDGLRLAARPGPGPAGRPRC